MTIENVDIGLATSAAAKIGEPASLDTLLGKGRTFTVESLVVAPDAGAVPEFARYIVPKGAAPPFDQLANYIVIKVRNEFISVRPVGGYVAFAEDDKRLHVFNQREDRWDILAPAGMGAIGNDTNLTAQNLGSAGTENKLLNWGVDSSFSVDVTPDSANDQVIVLTAGVWDIKANVSMMVDKNAEYETTIFVDGTASPYSASVLLSGQGQDVVTFGLGGPVRIDADVVVVTSFERNILPSGCHISVKSDTNSKEITFIKGVMTAIRIG